MAKKGASYTKMLKRKAALRKKKLHKKGEQRMVGEGKKCTLVIRGADTKIEGTFPVDPIVDATSYFKPGYKFTQRFRTGQWDGRIRLFKRVPRTFPAGLTEAVHDALVAVGTEVKIEDRREEPGVVVLEPNDMQLPGVSFDYPYEYQTLAAAKMVEKQRGILHIATNGGKTVIFALAIKMLKLPSLVVVPGKDLLHQTAAVLQEKLELDEIGMIGDKMWEPSPVVTVGTVGTLYARLATPQCRSVLNHFDVVICDECHKVGSDSWYQVMRASNAFYRYGGSGTPLNRTDGANIRLVGVTGPVIFEMRNKELIDRGISLPPRVRFLEIYKPEIDDQCEYEEAYEHGIVKNVYRNKAFCEAVAAEVDKGLNAVMLVKEIEHGEILDKKLWSYPHRGFIPHQFINGQEPTEVRKQALKDFKKGDLKVLIATKILGEGIDVPNIDVIANVGGGKSAIEVLQRMGRGLRTGGNSEELLVLESADFHNQYLLEHSLTRLEIYKAEECVKIESVKV